MTEATARPWRVEKAPMSSTPCIFGGDGFETWICGKFTNEIEADIYGPANAFLIVKAVNHHDALVSALEHLLDESEKHIFGNECQTERDAARSVLSQVRSET